MVCVGAYAPTHTIFWIFSLGLSRSKDKEDKEDVRNS
jgi:hypothetical protein